MPRTAVIIPVFNCGQALGPLLKGVLSHAPGAEIAVVDDGSTDGSAGAARAAGVRLLGHPRNLGKGAALHTGFRWALEHGFEYVITMDGDGQHAPQDLPQFLSSPSDLVLGRRSLTSGMMPFSRILSNRLSSFLVSIAAGKKVLDSQCGFRKVKAGLLVDFQPISLAYQFETELILHLIKTKSCTLDHVPVRTIYSGEKSHIRPLRDIREFLRALWRYR